MADGKKISEQIVELGERLGNVTDAAKGKDGRRGPRARWLVLPAAGAGSTPWPRAARSRARPGTPLATSRRARPTCPTS